MNVLEYLRCYTFHKRAAQLILIEPNYFFHLKCKSLEQKSMPFSVSKICNKRHQSILRRYQPAAASFFLSLSLTGSATGAGASEHMVGSSAVQHCSLVAHYRHGKKTGACLKTRQITPFTEFSGLAMWSSFLSIVSVKRCGLGLQLRRFNQNPELIQAVSLTHISRYSIYSCVSSHCSSAGKHCVNKRKHVCYCLRNWTFL